MTHGCTVEQLCYPILAMAVFELLLLTCQSAVVALPKGMRRRERRGRKEGGGQCSILFRDISSRRNCTKRLRAIFNAAAAHSLDSFKKRVAIDYWGRVHWRHDDGRIALSNCFETHTEQLVELLSSLPNKSRTRHNCAGFHALTQDLRRHPTGIIKSRRIQMIYYLSLFNNKRAFLNAIVTNKLNGHEEL